MHAQKTEGPALHPLCHFRAPMQHRRSLPGPDALQLQPGHGMQKLLTAKTSLHLALLAVTERHLVIGSTSRQGGTVSADYCSARVVICVAWMLHV